MGRNAHHNVAAKVLARKFVPQRIADEIHALWQRIILYGQSQLAREQLGNPVLEAFPLLVRKRKIAGIDAGTKRCTRVLRGNVTAPHAQGHDDRQPADEAKQENR